MRSLKFNHITNTTNTNTTTTNIVGYLLQPRPTNAEITKPTNLFPCFLQPPSHFCTKVKNYKAASKSFHQFNFSKNPSKFPTLSFYTSHYSTKSLKEDSEQEKEEVVTPSSVPFFPFQYVHKKTTEVINFATTGHMSSSDSNKNIQVLVPIANGSEEIEAVCIIDTLRRAGIQVTVAKVFEENNSNTSSSPPPPSQDLVITASRNTKLVADMTLEEASKIGEYDCIALPGGLGGAKIFASSESLVQLLKEQKKCNKFYAAICASPALVFGPHEILVGVKEATCYPNFFDTLPIHISDTSKEKTVCVDGKCITSQGPGTSLHFSLKLVQVLAGVEKAKEIAKAMLVRDIEW